MSTRSRRLFVTPAEFFALVQKTSSELSDIILLEIEHHLTLESWNHKEHSLLSARTAWATARLPSPEEMHIENLEPNRLGWMLIPVPVIRDSKLMMIQISSKSDWLDEVTGQILDNPESLHRFERWWRKWKLHFRSPVWVKDLKTGEKWPIPGIRYSPGVVEWVQDGGTLHQEGTLNQEFLILNED